MYRYLQRAQVHGSMRSTRSTRTGVVAVAARHFTNAKASKLGEVTPATGYYDFNDDVVSSFMKTLKDGDAAGASRSAQRVLRPTLDQIREKKAKTNTEMRAALFTKDIVTTFNLFTVCLRSNELPRARALLATMYTLIRTQSNKSPMIDTFNSYFMKWTEDQTVSVDEITQWFAESLEQFSQVTFDDRTYAILIDAVMSRSSGTPRHRDLVRMYQEQLKRSDLTLLLRHADIFKTDNLRQLVQDFGVPTEELPADVQEFFQTEHEARAQQAADAQRAARQVSFARDELPELDKDSEHLRSVDTFGLKVIRHSIMALAARDGSGLLAEFAAKLDTATPLDAARFKTAGSGVDFFSIHQSLSGEDRDVFNAALEQFNYDRQLRLETSGIESAREKWRHEFEALQKMSIVTTPSEVSHFLFQWQEELTELIREEVDRCRQLMDAAAGGTAADRKALRGREYAPFISLISPEKMAVITILELLKTNASPHAHTAGLRTARAVLAVGSAVETEYHSQETLKATEDRLQRQRLKKFFKTESFKARMFLKSRAPREEDLSDPAMGWTHESRAKLGSVLISMLLRVAKIRVQATDPATKAPVEGLVPAFYHSFQYVSGTKVGVIKLQPEFATKLAKDDVNSIITPQGLPMLVRPRPWTSFKDGGYLTTRSLLARSKNSAEQIAYLRAASENGQLQEVFDGLNVLGNTAWTVNRRVYRLVAEVWNSGRAFLDIPGISETPVYPEKPAPQSPPELLRNWKQDVQRKSNEFSKDRSLRCDTNYKLEIARAFLGEKFYFPHNLDFRGRAYPLSPHFNHLGNDMTRGLLMFWDGKPLGEHGFTWLKVHLSNLFGIDKVSLADRVRFVNDNLENFAKCCEAPFSEAGAMWQRADKPWQALATMFEVVEAAKLDDPSTFVSHQPVHQDGTCNGLQHYAALGGDVEGARQVNLVPQDRPADVYTFVASLVQARVDADAANGVEEALKVQAHIKRKVVKQTIMTNVYGVTFVGARDQIAKQLADTFPDRLELTQVSRYLTKQVFASIRELFEKAHLIQDWLSDAAKVISKSFYLYADESRQAPTPKPDMTTSVIWTTPLGLPIVQPYRAVSKRQVQTNLQSVFISDPYLISPVDSRKQQSAFPPNFVHSLDATHMLKSAVQCGAAGIAYAAVHDSYWTHAADVDTMGSVLRSEFVALYQLDIIRALKDEFEARYADYVQLVPLKSSLPEAKALRALKEHLGTLKDKKLTVHDELYLEVERRKLLRSSDPAKVQQGREMVTTISLMHDYDFSDYRGTSSKPNTDTVLAPFKLPAIPAKGDLDVHTVKDSPYFFS